MRARLTTAAVQAQSRYKMSLDEKIWEISVYEKGDLVYLNPNFPKKSQKVNHPSQKLQEKKTDRYLVADVRSKTVIVE